MVFASCARDNRSVLSVVETALPPPFPVQELRANTALKRNDETTSFEFCILIIDANENPILGQLVKVDSLNNPLQSLMRWVANRRQSYLDFPKVPRNPIQNPKPFRFGPSTENAGEELKFRGH